MKQKAPPTVADDQVAEPCFKCNGSGFFCLGTVNGRPYSNTGFSCYTCNGVGWKVIKKATVKARERRDRKAQEAAAVAAAKYEAEREAREAAEAVAAAKAQAAKEAAIAATRHLSMPGSRITLTATVTARFSFEGYYGTGICTKLITDDGHRLIYWNSIHPKNGDAYYADKGDKIEFSTGIKSHGEDRDGLRETVLTRVTKAKLLTPTQG